MAAALTDKQQTFVTAYIGLGNAVEAYRRAYDAEKMNANTVNKAAQELLDNPKIKEAIEVTGSLDKTKNSAPLLKGLSAAKIEQWPIDKLVPYAQNARSHPPAQVAQLAASIKAFGFNVPCLVDKDGTLVAGHGRVMGAKELGLKTVPVIRLAHLTDAQIRAFRIADNKIALNSEWLDDLLSDELAALKELDFDLSLTGFDDNVLERLTADPQAPFPALTSDGQAQLRQMTFVLDLDQCNTVEQAIGAAKELAAPYDGPNDNSNGNAIAFICHAWADAQRQRPSS